MLDDLVIRCEYFEDGWTAVYTPKHELECEFAKIKWKNSECDVTTTRKEMKEHAEQWLFRTQKCTKGCSKILMLSEVESHNCISALEDLVNDLQEENKSVREDLYECKELIKSLQSEIEVKKYVHEDIKWSECKMAPIKTERFLCQSCDDYNLWLYWYWRQVHKHHSFYIYGALGVLILHESDTPEVVYSDQIMKKEIFLKNVGDKVEITVYPYKQPRPLQEFKSTFSTINTNEAGSVYFHFQVPSDAGVYENQFRFFWNKRHESFGAVIKIRYEVVSN